MDSFMDKLAQRLTAQEMIKANSTADMKEMERLQSQLAQYDTCLQEMRKLNLKNMETADNLSRLVEESIHKIEEAATGQGTSQGVKESLEESLTELKKYIEALSDKSDDYLHKENVKVYRNVQAALIEENTKQTETLLASQKKLKSGNTAILVISILAFLTAAGSLAFQILTYFGVF